MASLQRKEILVIGGTGAQGMPVVHTLSASSEYSVRVLTRDPASTRAKSLAALPNVTLIQGTQDSEADLHRAFKGVYGAWVNLDGFTLGEMKELYFAFRCYEIARGEGLKHYVWANCDYALRIAGWREEFHWGHNDAKGRVGDFILAQDQKGMASTLFTVGPYMDMLIDGMLMPAEELDDGTLVWENPSEDGKIPLMALHDVGVFVKWIFDHPERSTGINLEMATDQVSFSDITSAFARVTGRKGIHRRVSFEEYLPKKEPYPNAPANWANTDGSPATMTWRQNFTAWWKFWGGGLGATRDMKLLDKIYPGRIKTVEEWMRKVNYQGGKRGAVLKNIGDLIARRQAAG
ncbi:uncharacterized protein A1O5_10278 [Cladophialophora psammophila CBS 110553]|uniref:NmrA-like domain-containing protein n=1 Tax=Cladophialophora psammophila CBS 110553 TaxID=1182543 RepID=W9WER1_9EURO|nr:uncharacterized protein A1O5_10278 [Cladophialophora psammophila CBS 110553]EXJ66607.1 hypothetical protein A1O5_10278 [Cladophialophora psammophila CBS 110553]